MLKDIQAVLANRRGNRSRLYQALFSGPDGTRVLADICKMAHLGHSTYVKDDPTRTMMNEGARNLALIILQLAKVDPQQITEKLQQHQTQEEP